MNKVCRNLKIAEHIQVYGAEECGQDEKRKQPLLLAVTLMGICALVGCGERNTVTNYQDLPEDITSITFFGNKYEPENVTVIEEIISGFIG